LSKIAIIGAGAVGSYYGSRLAEAGNDVQFLMRRDYQAVRDHGLKVTSQDGDFVLKQPAVYRKSEDIGITDWVVCALKSTSLEDAEKLVKPCVGPETRILALMNGLGVEERFAGWFGPDKIFGGLAFTCINRGEPGLVNHLAYGTVTLAHFQNIPTELEKAEALWKGSRVKIATAPSLLRARWEKLCWNIPFNGLAVTGGGITTESIVGNPELRGLALSLMQEVIAAGNADLKANSETARIDGPAVIERMFSLTDTMGPYRPSTMIDFIEGREMEVEAIFGEPLRRAKALGLPVPQLALITGLLRVLNHRK
jgi:2-dehydropantoate 2-reductase